MTRLNTNHNSKKNHNSLCALIAQTKDDMESVNHLILSKTKSEISLILEITNYLILSGGKRLRPMLTLLCAQMFGYKGTQHIQLAASVEFMHTATLLHDDVVDESNLRRGKSTARTLWGNQASVLVGDYLLGQAFRTMVDSGSMEALRILSCAASIIAKGEVMQLAAANNLTTKEQDYLSIIEAKTATLFSAAAEIGPVIGGASQESCTAMRSYGLNLGLAFQLIDDALDYGGSSKELGKNTGDDFREGKVTLPVILSYQRSNEEEKKFWKKAIESKQNEDTESLQYALALIKKHCAINETILRAHDFAKRAQQALSLFPPSAEKTILIDLTDFCINRVH